MIDNYNAGLIIIQYINNYNVLKKEHLQYSTTSQNHSNQITIKFICNYFKIYKNILNQFNKQYY